MDNMNDIIGTSLEKIKEFADTETVIGQPITTANGTTIVPVSKVSMGFATGALGSKAKEGKDAKDIKPRIGGGGGTGVTVTPIAFLVISASGKVDLMPINAPSAEGTVDKITSIIERSPDIVERFKKIFAGDAKKAKKAEPAEDKPEDSDTDAE